MPLLAKDFQKTFQVDKIDFILLKVYVLQPFTDLALDNLFSYSKPALQAATILVAMASGKKFWQPKFWQKSPVGDQQIKRETYLKNYQ